MKAVTVTVLSLVFKLATGKLTNTLYDFPQNASNRVIQLQGYNKVVGKDMKLILNCSSNAMKFGEHTAEFLSNGNTINYIRYFEGICYKTVNMSVCDSLICDCYVDSDTSWYSIAIEKPANDDKFSCLIRERKTITDYVYALEGIWSKSESKSRVIQVAHTASHPRQSFGVTNTKQETIAIILIIAILLLLWPIIIFIRYYILKKRKNVKGRQNTYQNEEGSYQKNVVSHTSTNGGSLGHRRKLSNQL